ncbi:ABC-2 type transporter [Dillenia turbinata]|uniref:ABC-2 type transporter n=1 Tax=Dillenia turbinata TaxID=194707 RepID=A0AAN8W6C9_9MAGN
MASALAGDDLARSGSGRRSWASASFREVWNTPPDVFSRSSREDNDEEELRWAALERLPTYDRLRKGMLKQVLDNGRVVQSEVDIANLGLQEKKMLMESILKVVEEDNEKFLTRLRDRIDSHIIADNECDFIMVEQSVLGLIRLAPSKKRVIKILQGVSGIVKPSRMTLLLGPPSSGKTTLLLALAGKLDDDLRVNGKVTYCGHEMHEFVPQRTCAYISQHDLHYGEMTVRETLDFSGRCLGVGTRYEMLAELSRREKEAGVKPDPEIDAFMKATALSGQKTSLVTDYVLKDDSKTFTIMFSFRFFRQFLAFFWVHQVALSLFRFIAAVGRTQVVSNTLGTFTLLLVFVLGGFIVAKNDIKPWMIWGYYVSPMMYGQNAIVMNEFLDKRWGAKNTDPRIDAPTVGKALLKSRGFFTDDYWFWICVGALVGFSILFNILFIAALTYLKPLGDTKTVIVDDDNGKKNKKLLSGQRGEKAQEGIDMGVRNGSEIAGSSDPIAKRGMVLPFQPLSLAFNHVNYYVDMPTVAIETVYVTVQTLAYTLLLYSMIGFEWTAAKFFYFYYFILMCFIYFTMYGMMVVALTPGHQIAAIVMSFFLSFWNLFSGFLIPKPQIPVWWSWYYWASPVAWTLYGLVTSQVGDKNAPLEIPGAGTMSVKTFLKEYLSFDYDFLPAVVGAHIGFVLLFFFVFAYGIKFLNFQRR